MKRKITTKQPLDAEYVWKHNVTWVMGDIHTHTLTID